MPPVVRLLAPSWVGLLATAVTVAAAGVAGATHGVARGVWVAVAALAALLQFAGNRAVARVREGQVADAAQLAEDVRTGDHVAVGAALVPLLRLVAQVHEHPPGAERTALRRAAVTGVLAASAASLGPIGEVRACWYALDVGPAGDLRGLRHDDYAGRPDQPRTRFDAATPTGRRVLDAVLADDRVFVADVRSQPPEAWEDDEHPTGAYVTFLAVPVRGEEQIHGMLSVDAVHPGTLVLARDEPIMLIFARILAAVLAEPVDLDPAPD